MNLRQRIDELVEKHESMRAVSFVTNIDVGYLHHLREGTKDNPSNITCEKLGLKKRMVIQYTKLTSKQT
jgi:hypothetical protein